MSSFLMSSHNLNIETRRWQRRKILPEDRNCPSCKNIVEDEMHVFVKCQHYNDPRGSFFQGIKKLITNLENEWDDHKFNQAMASSDSVVNL